MSDQITTIGAGDNATFNVYYEAENRQKRVEWVSGSCTVNKLYSALQNLFDELTQMDDGVPMSAQTPTEYTIGIIDAGDDDPWFIDRTTVEKLTGGAITTASWTRTQDSNTGIVRVPVSSNNITEAKIGLDITHTDGDAGTLLDVIEGGSVLWIRPDSDAAANNWDSVAGTITCDALTATQTDAAGDGESLWANIYSLGAIETNTHLYIYQNGSLLTAYKDATDWWSDEHIDVLVNVKEVDTEVDEGYITVLARQYSKTDDYYIVDLAAGGRNPIPLSTGDDLNNETGYRQMILTDASGNFTVEEIIEDDSDSTIQGIVTSNTGTAPNITIQYYLVGDPLTDFSAGTGGFTGQTSSTTATAVAPTDVGPAGLAGLSITHTKNETFDIDEDGTTENYSIVIDVSDEILADAFEWAKYITRRGAPDDGFTDDLEGEQYIGSDYRLIHGGISGTVNEGEPVLQANTLAEGIIVASNTTDSIIILRNSRGTFNTTDLVTETTNNGTFTPSTSATSITPIKVSPYGSFAGGVWFCAPGVVLDNVPAADANNYQLTDDNGNVVVAPTKVTVKVSNTKTNDRIAVFRLTGVGGDIKKDTYTIDVSQGAAGSNTVVIDSAVAIDEPGKSAGGIIRVVDADGDIEDRYRFTSWTSGATSTFNLFDLAATADAGGSATSLLDADGNFIANGVLIGDIVYNTIEPAYAYVTAVAAGELTTTNTGSDLPITDWSSDGYEVGNTVRAYTTSDKTYIPLIDIHETADGSEESIITYDLGGNPNFPVRIRARQAGDIIPFETDSTVTNVGMTISVIRTDDTIYT